MNLNNLFWLMLLASMLQPLLRQRLLESARRRLRASLERDSEEVIRAILQTDSQMPIDLILQSPWPPIRS